MILLWFCSVTNSLNHPWISVRTMGFHVGVGISGSVGSQHTAVTDWAALYQVFKLANSKLPSVIFWMLTDEQLILGQQEQLGYSHPTSQWGADMQLLCTSVWYLLHYFTQPSYNNCFLYFFQTEGFPLLVMLPILMPAFWHDSPWIHFSK